VKDLIKRSLVTVVVLSAAACTVSSPVNTPANKKFSVSSLNHSYLKRKLDTWVAAGNGTNLVKELMFAQHKHGLLVKEIIDNDLNPQQYFDTLTSLPAIMTRKQQDASFSDYIDSLNPNPPPLSSCLSLFNQGMTESKTYTIDPDGPGAVEPFEVYCNMNPADGGGGWTLFTSRSDSAPFETTNTVLPNNLDGRGLSDERWAVLKANATYGIMGKSSPSNKIAIGTISKFTNANCTPLTNNLSDYVLAHYETSGCGLNGVDYCLAGTSSNPSAMYNDCGSFMWDVRIDDYNLYASQATNFYIK
jgi:hypothetical protein